MKRKIFIVISSLSVLFLLSACGKDLTTNEDSKSTDSSNKGMKKESQDENKNDSNNEIVEEEKGEPLTDTEESKLEINDEVQTDSSKSIQILSSEDAIEYLKEQLPEGKNEDISFGAEDTLSTDENGSYYVVQLIDLPLRLAGKTGTLGYYKVYQHGTFMLFQ